MSHDRLQRNMRLRKLSSEIEIFGLGLLLTTLYFIIDHSAIYFFDVSFVCKKDLKNHPSHDFPRGDVCKLVCLTYLPKQCQHITEVMNYKLSKY